jgi:hypothetical protein
MLALMRGSINQVEKALDDDPEAATLPFFDHGWQEPLSFAIKSNCGLDMFQLLLARGAKAHEQALATLTMELSGTSQIADDDFGFGQESRTEQAKEQTCMDMVDILLNMKVDPREPSSYMGPSSLDLAVKYDNKTLIERFTSMKS